MNFCEKGPSDVGFLKNILWEPMLLKDLIPESQLVDDDNLGINKKPGSQKAIVYCGIILRDFKVVLKPCIKDNNSMYEVSQS